MYHLYPRLLQALVHSYSQAEPLEAEAMLGAIATEIANDHKLFESLLSALAKASRQNNRLLLSDLDRYRAAAPRMSGDVSLAFQRWQHEDRLLRAMIDQAFRYLSTQPDQDQLSQPDRDQLLPLQQDLRSGHD